MLKYQQHQRTARFVRKSYMLQEKKSKLVNMGDCAFSVVAPKYWNELLDYIRNIELPLDIFKKKIKTHYFKMVYCREKVQWLDILKSNCAICVMFFYLFGVLRHFQHCIYNIATTYLLFLVFKLVTEAIW